jgi:hypothetical protein
VRAPTQLDTRAREGLAAARVTLRTQPVARGPLPVRFSLRLQDQPALHNRRHCPLPPRLPTLKPLSLASLHPSPVRQLHTPPFPCKPGGQRHPLAHWSANLSPSGIFGYRDVFSTPSQLIQLRPFLPVPGACRRLHSPQSEPASTPTCASNPVESQRLGYVLVRKPRRLFAHESSPSCNLFDCRIASRARESRSQPIHFAFPSTRVRNAYSAARLLLSLQAHESQSRTRASLFPLPRHSRDAGSPFPAWPGEKWNEVDPGPRTPQRPPKELDGEENSATADFLEI